MHLFRAVAFAFVMLAGLSQAGAMTFAFQAPSTVRATGEIVAGDAAHFAALRKFTTLQQDSPGGSVGEALRIAENMDKRGKIRTVVRPGASCASACAMALFVSGSSRVVYMGGRVGIHSCATQDGTAAPECNSLMAANATAHGVPWGVIEGFGNANKPSDMIWLSAEDAECWGMMKWSEIDTSNNGIACFMKGTMTGSARTPADVNAANADDITCRMAAPTSRIYVPGGGETRGFSDAYRSACERVATAPTTPKYAAIDILLWLSLTDPNVMAIKPGTTMFRILNQDSSQVSNCWKCLTIMGMSEAMHGYQAEGLTHLQSAVYVARKQTGSVPQWLVSRVQAVAADVSTTTLGRVSGFSAVAAPARKSTIRASTPIRCAPAISCAWLPQFTTCILTSCCLGKATGLPWFAPFEPRHASRCSGRTKPRRGAVAGKFQSR